MRRAVAQLGKGDVLTVTRLDQRRRKQPRHTSDSRINQKEAACVATSGPSLGRKRPRRAWRNKLAAPQ
ncbi:hypothetical protein MPC4_400021 [Methylocella tundrae]|uniref:Uncharacterized protein n=1 Tax=Methylocella tundrae TaxID=227605 RepID=A0A8B6M9L9_METTU|nr:hypothetical protein MPC1_110023 [Methylocella tundrae]VTZ51620.1 hypothetical protein MPC4_400021 [Methylocella tundrae]